MGDQYKGDVYQVKDEFLIWRQCEHCQTLEGVIGESDGVPAQGQEDQGTFLLAFWVLEHFKVKGIKKMKQLGLIAGLVGQCYTRLSFNLNDLYLKFKTIIEFSL